MSYDVRLAIDTGGERMAEVTETKCPTYNLGPMFRLALGMNMQSSSPAPYLDGMLAADALPVVQAALTDMELHPAKYKALNPSNGWGDYEGAVKFMRWLRDACRDHPKATVFV